MRTMDFSPLFRHSVGFDQIERLLDRARHMDEGNGYPPYNIEQVDEDAYRITMAVAGFAEEDLDVTVDENTLVVSGKKEAEETEEKVFLHRGIASRAFERRFQLADHIKVVGGSLRDGLLHIELERVVPEEKKPRKVAITSAEGSKKLAA